jgi:uncharacterized protein involved in exopolysaccharide biosynthesis/Mrp family chromosome partitioning ATPase
MNTDPTRTSLTPPGRRRKPVNIPDVILRRFVFILIAGGALAALFAPLLMLGSRSVYTTSGMLAIDPGKEPTLTGRERETIPGNLGDYTRTLLNRLTSGDVLVEAMQAVPTNDWPSFLHAGRSPEANIGRLFKAIKAKEVARTYLMTVEISGDDPHGLAPMLNAVLDAFIAKLRRELEQQNARRLEYLREERDQIVTRITEERQRILTLADHVPNKAFLHESYSVHLSKLEQIQRLYWEAEALRAQREGDYQRTLINWKDLQQLSLQAYADERVADNFGINRIEQWTYEQLQSLRSTIDGLTTNNEDRTYVEMRMDAMNEYLRTYKSEVNDTTIRILKEKRNHDLTTELITASNAMLGANMASDYLSERLAAAKTEATETSEAIFQAADITFTVTQLRDRLTALNTRIDDVEMESKAPLRLYIDREAGVPNRPSSNTRPQLAMLGLMLGFGLVAGLVIGFEFLDDRIRGPAEIEAAIGGPAPDPIPLVSGSRFDRVLLDHPDDPAGTAIRALVIRLNRERTCHQARVFAFCPSGPGVGNTSLALNAAHGLARFVPKVLMISFSPSALKIAHAGVALLKEPSGLVQAVTHDAERGVDLVAIDLAGERLPSKVGVALLIDRVRRAYDVVVLDLGIVPQDDLAMSLLHEVDSVIFTAREDMTMFTELRRAIDSASLAGVPSMTAVLNGSRRPSVNRLPVLLQQGLRQVSGLHHRAREEWKRRLKRGGAA